MKFPALWFFAAILYIFLPACSTQQLRDNSSIFLGQGVMVGEVTAGSALLQTRLTATEELTDGDLPGADGWIKFSWWLDQASDQRNISDWLAADPMQDHIVRLPIAQLEANQRYHYQAEATSDTVTGPIAEALGSFRTLPGGQLRDSLSFVVVTGMNYYFFHYGNYDGATAYKGPDKTQGYPALQSILHLEADYFIGTGDNVYFDHPAIKNYQRSIDNGKKPLPGLFHGKEVTDELGMRKKYHVQFVQPRFRNLFAKMGTYWEKDDHDYRVNDGDPYSEFPISHELGIKNFREQLPVVDPRDASAQTYRTHRMTRDLQIWLLEGRDFRSANDLLDGPTKTLWGVEQKEWLKETLLESDAAFKIIISPTPMVGPDDAYKKDNHVNPLGFRHEGDAFFQWLLESSFSTDSLFLVCGDRHWQYHATHPTGFQEFSCGALVDANSRAGRLAGDPKSTDPEGQIKQHYVQGRKDQASGGFLQIKVSTEDGSRLHFIFRDELGQILYQKSF